MFRNRQKTISSFEFCDNNEQEKRLEIARLSMENSDYIAQQIAGDMYIELAFNSEITEHRLTYLSVARKCWDRSLRESEVIDKHSVRSAIQLANYAIYRAFVAEENIAGLSQIKDAYYDMVLICNRTQEELLELKNEKQSNRSKNLVGAYSESVVLSLLQRFNLKDDRPEWTVLPSLVSQDTGKKKTKKELKEAWDVSVYSHYSEETDLLFKIQVKTAHEYSIYASDISIVNLKSIIENLPLVNSETGITKLLINELDGDNNSSRKLDNITENLLDALG